MATWVHSSLGVLVRLESVGSKQCQLFLGKLKGATRKQKETDAPCFGVTEGPPDNHLVYALGRAGLEGDNVRKWSQQLEPQVVEPREDKHYSDRGSGNPFSLNRDSLDIETYLGGMFEESERDIPFRV